MVSEAAGTGEGVGYGAMLSWEVTGARTLSGGRGGQRGHLLEEAALELGLRGLEHSQVEVVSQKAPRRGWLQPGLCPVGSQRGSWRGGFV